MWTRSQATANILKCQWSANQRRHGHSYVAPSLDATEPAHEQETSFWVALAEAPCASSHLTPTRPLWPDAPLVLSMLRRGSALALKLGPLAPTGPDRLFFTAAEEYPSCCFLPARQQ